MSFLPVVDEVTDIALEKLAKENYFSFEPILRTWYATTISPARYEDLVDSSHSSESSSLSSSPAHRLVVTRPALVRSGSELGSDEVRRLDRGELATEATTTSRALSSCGTMRVELASPYQGWVSWKCVRPASWVSTAAATGRTRWAVDLATWRPSLGEMGEEWALLVSLIAEPGERDRVVAYHRWLDRARALAGRLLARRCCELALGINFDQIEIERTKGGKPFLAALARRRPSAPNFNFNVSHDGRYVVLASEPYCVCGIDVAAPERLRRAVTRGRQNMRVDADALPRSLSSTRCKASSSKDLVELDRACKQVDLLCKEGTDDDVVSTIMRDQLSERERAWVEDVDGCAPAGQTRAERFRCVWSAKEALTKARGDGLACNFGTIDLDLEHRYQWNRKFTAREIIIDGELQKQWTLHGQLLDSGHVVTVARGRPNDIIDEFGAFRDTFQVASLDDAKFLEDPYPDFVFLDFADLVPADKLDDYARAQHGDKLEREERRTRMHRCARSENDLDRAPPSRLVAPTPAPSDQPQSKAVTKSISALPSRISFVETSASSFLRCSSDSKLAARPSVTSTEEDTPGLAYEALESVEPADSSS